MKRIYFVIIFTVMSMGQQTLKAQVNNGGSSAYPIIFVHGINSSDNMWFDSGLINHLESLGYKKGAGFNVNLDLPQTLGEITLLDSWVENRSGDLWTINFESLGEFSQLSNQAGIFKQAYSLKIAIDLIKRYTGKNKVIIVSHSMGGLAATKYVTSGINDDGKRLYYSDDVAKVITLGTPFGGFDENLWDDLLGNSSWWVEPLLTWLNGIDKKSEAMRDLSYSNVNHNNVFLFGGYENEVADNYYSKDVNYDADSEDLIQGLNNSSWPNQVSMFSVVGSYAGGYLVEDNDLVVKVEDQQPNFFVNDYNAKLINATHVSIAGSCSEAGSHDAIIESLDEASNIKYSYSVDESIRYQGFISQQGDYVSNNKDDDYYTFKVSEPSKITFTLENSPVPLKITIIDQDMSTALDSTVVGPNESVVFTFQTSFQIDSPKNLYLQIQGEAMPSSNGFSGSTSPCDSELVTTRQPYYFRIDQEKIEIFSLSNGAVSPSNGYTTDIYDFSVDVNSPDQVAPDEVKLILNGQEYILEAESNVFSQAVSYNSTINNLTAGIYEYHFEAILNGTMVRYPIQGYLDLTVNESAEGWDLSVGSSSSISPSQPIEGSSISVTANVQNNGIYTYDEAIVEARLINPSGTTIDKDEQIARNIIPNGSVTQDLSIQMPSSGPDGTYKVIISARGDLDENIDNNVISKSFYIGELLGTNSFRAIDNERTYNQGDSFSINGYSFNIYSVSNGEVILDYQGDYTKFFTGDLAIYEDIDVAMHITDAYSYQYNNVWTEQVVFYPAEATTNAPQFESENIYLKQGQSQTTRLTLPSGYNYDALTIIDEDGYQDEIDNWIANINELSGGVLEITWNIPANEPINRHEIYVMLEYNSNLPTYSKVYLNIVAPEPIINQVSSNLLSADDIITINGNNFGSNGGVNFNDISGSINSWSNTEILVTVPEGIVDGLLFVNNSNGVSNGKAFEVLSSTGDPIIQQAIPNQSIQAGDTIFVTQLSNTFSDPNGDNLSFSSQVDPGVAVSETDLLNGDLILIADSSSSGDYIVTITATDADNASVTDEFSVNVEPLIQVPATPALISPSNASFNTELNVQLIWSSVSDANYYELQIGNTEQFTTLLIEENNISDTTYQVNNLDYNTSYHWRVRGINEFGSGDWSPNYFFTTKQFSDPPNQSPLLVSPESNSINVPTNVTLKWEATPKADEYLVGYSRNSDGSLADYTQVGTTTYDLTSLEPNTTYYWFVTGLNTYGLGPSSDTLSFTTGDSPFWVPELQTPENGAIDQEMTVTVSWSDIPDAETYDIQASRTTDFVNSIYAEEFGLTDTTYFLQNVVYGGEHYWRVRANKDSLTSNWSEYFQFTTKEAEPLTEKPVLTYPLDGDVGIPVNITFKWDSVNAATGYFMNISDSPDLSNILYDPSTQGATEYTIEGLSENTTYYWAVATVNEAGLGAWSDTLSFTTLQTIQPLSAPDLLTPEDLANIVANDSTSFTWRSVNNATEYEMQFDSEPIFSTGSDTSFILLTDAVGEKTWQVRAKNADTVSVWSEIRNFTVLADTNFYTVNIEVNPEASGTASGGGTYAEGTEVVLSSVANEEYQFEGWFGSNQLLSIETPYSFILTSDTTIVAQFAEDVIMGDVTGNGSVSALDASEILKHTVKISPPYPLAAMDSVAADVTCNGSISALDAANILKYTVSLVSDLSCNTETMAKSLTVAKEIEIGWEIRRGGSGQEISLPLNIERMTGEFFSLDAEVSIPEDLTFEGVENLPEDWISLSQVQNGQLLFSAAGTSALTTDNDKPITVRFSFSDITTDATISGQLIFDEMSQITLDDLELIDLPDQVTLNQNYPNPFNPTTKISYSIPVASEVRLEVFNLLGQRVTTLTQVRQNPGTYSVEWNASTMSSGVYVYRLSAGDKVLIKKMMLIK